VLFFWAHWCPDCKIQGPILSELLAKPHPRMRGILLARSVRDAPQPSSPTWQGPKADITWPIFGASRANRRRRVPQAAWLTSE
jgi:thiol-disulfide isomerase/thioredoxin